MPSSSFLQQILPLSRPRTRTKDVEMNENTASNSKFQKSTNDEENLMGVFTPPSRYIPPPFGYALGLVPTSSHPLAGEQLDAVPRPLMDDSPGRLSAITSVQPISTSIPSAPALGSPFQFKFGEKRPISRKRTSHLEGRAGKYKGTERLPISEESMVEKTRVVEQHALATRQIINQKSAEVEAQAEKTRFIEQEGLATKLLLGQREERIIELEAQVQLYVPSKPFKS
ncbi:hypothetical protein CVT25_014357 [Psilocybe cyanescens]|uniref:Uncharacterized protein n=1 Tax=Psilocybe cyanescens TaxID=93625 RepID=A0A409WUE2_PSICY|nr:hypothetical protein CVT25_014357 [Psilocybe cyanescens]